MRDSQIRMAGLVVLLTGLLACCGCDRGPADAGPATQPAHAADLLRTAQRGPVRLEVRIDRGEVTVPEPVTLTITAEAERGVDLTMPEIGDLFGDFGVAEITDAEPVETDFTVTHNRVCTLETYAAGSLAIPAVQIEFTDQREKADGSHAVYQDVVRTEPIPVQVRPGLADVKGPATMPMPGWQKVILWGLAAIAAMVAIAMLARWWRRRRKDVERERPWAARLPAHLWALAELDKLAAENLLGRDRVQEYYYRVNALLRRYIELRFGLMAGEQTSEEFIRALQVSALFDEDHKEVLRRFVQSCDPVKYARHQPDRKEIDWVQASARNFVLETAENAEGRKGPRDPGREGTQGPRDRRDRGTE